MRGFHIAPSEDYLKIRSVKEQILINQGGTTEGFESFSDYELVSYELLKFGRMLYKTNFNILEWLFHGITIWEPNHKSPLPELRRLMKACLPADVPIHYRGMAHQNYQKYLARPDSPDYKPTAKKYLYVLRGLLAAEYVHEWCAIEANILTLAGEVATTKDQECIAKLVEFKKDNAENIFIPAGLKGDAEAIIKKYYKKDYGSCKPNDALRESLNNWMLKVRRYE